MRAPSLPRRAGGAAVHVGTIRPRRRSHGCAGTSRRKLLIYGLTFFVAVTLDWLIPRFMPGGPVQGMLSRMSLQPEALERMQEWFMRSFGLDRPIWEQYLNFWGALLQGDLGISVFVFPTPGDDGDPQRDPVHARPAGPGHRAQLDRGQLVRGVRGPPEVARQHRPARSATS